MKIILSVLSAIVGLAVLTYFVPDIWKTNRNYSASQKPSAAEKMARFRTCLINAGFVEGMPEGDFVLDPLYETIDGVQTIKAFFYRFPDNILNDENLVLKIQSCKNEAGR